MNNWIFTGNLGQDSDLKYSAAGMAICTFSVAVKSGFGDKSKTTWVKCGLFGKRAEGSLPQYLVKGTQVCIAGEAYLDEWQDQTGATQKMLKVNVDKLDLVGGKPSGQSTGQAPQQNAQPAQRQGQNKAANVPAGFDDFEDVPF